MINIEYVKKLIYEYTESSKMLDEKVICNILEYLIFKFNLSLYVKGISVIDIPNNTLAFYSSESQTIYINYKKMIYFVGLDCSIRFLNLEYQQKLLMFNLHVLKILFHEVEHVKQEEKILLNNTNLETIILAESTEIEKNLKKRLLYNRTLYFCNPLERQAEFNAYRNIITNFFELTEQRLTKSFYTDYRKLRIKDYKFKGFKSETPFKIFCSKYQYIENLQPIDDTIYQLDLKMRLDLGLVIKRQEYAQIRLKGG